MAVLRPHQVPRPGDGKTYDLYRPPELFSLATTDYQRCGSLLITVLSER